MVAYYLGKGKSEAQARELADDEDEYDKTFYIPPVARWGAIKDLKHDIGAELNKATEAIEEHNATLEGVLVSIDFNIKNKLSDKKLRDLLSHFSRYRLRNQDFERPDLLGTAYEYLIKMFADSAGKKAASSIRLLKWCSCWYRCSSLTRACAYTTPRRGRAVCWCKPAII